MEFDHPSDDCQAKARRSSIVSDRLFGAIVFLENMRYLVGGNPDSLVCNRDNGLLLGPRAASHMNSSAFIRIMYCIIEQIGKKRLDMIRCPRGAGATQVGMDGYVALLGYDLYLLNSLTQQFTDIEFFPDGQSSVARAEPGQL